MNSPTNNAQELAEAFEQRSNVAKLDLLNTLVFEGHAEYENYSVDGANEMTIHGVTAAGTDPLDFINNYCAMARRIEQPSNF